MFSRTTTSILIFGAVCAAALGCQRSSPAATGPAAAEERNDNGRLAPIQRIERVITKMERLRLGEMEVPREDGELLRLLVRSIDARHVVEIGTSTGYSALWLCAGLEETDGNLTTFEIDPDRARLARQHFAEAGVTDRVTLILGDAHREVGTLSETIDLVFIDADKDGYLDYLQQLLPLVREGGIIAAHNMNWPRPDPRYISAITTDTSLHTIFLNMDRRGMSVTQKRSPR
jgi:predicted O-methyltransferase YrrM